VRHILRVIGVVVAAMLITNIANSAVASADALVGKTYADAQKEIADWNANPKVATVSGSRLALDDCIVVSWQKSMFRDSSGDGPTNDILVNLNCNSSVATPGHPGNSAMSPQGKQSKKDDEDAQYINDHPETCETSEDAAKYCESLCNRTGLCSVDG
jgi:hypothetical protein